MTVFTGRPLTAAILSNLEQVGGLLVGDGVAPDTGGWDTDGTSFTGYVVLHPLLGGELDGPIEDPHADAMPRYQINAYGATREQCELLADKARVVMLTVPIIVAGRRVVDMTVDGLGGARRDDTDQPAIWVSAERYRPTTTPA